jgi:hypothetical protein
MSKRTKATITVSRTVQLQPYTPYKLEISTEIESEEGITLEDISGETENLQEYIDKNISNVIEEIERSNKK